MTDRERFVLLRDDREDRTVVFADPIAVATALMLQAAEDYSTLVLCPKNLQPMWEKHIEEYDINAPANAAIHPCRARAEFFKRSGFT